MNTPRRVVEEPGRYPPALLAAVAVLVLVVLVWRVLQAYEAGDVRTVTPAPRKAASSAASAAASVPAIPAPVAPPAAGPATTSAPAASAAPPPDPPPPRPAAITLPYRYMGSTGNGPDAELVFFGRGRTVTLRGPGPLDDEFVIESVLDGRAQWRHLPSGTSQFMELAVRPAGTPARPARPEDFPRD